MRQVGPGMLAASALTLLFLVAPILVAAPLAFSEARTLIFPPPGWSLKWFADFFSRADFVTGLQISLFSALVSTVLATLLGGLAAYGLVRMRGRSKVIGDLFLNAPLLIPVLVIGIAMLFFLARFKIAGTLPGLVIGHTMLVLPLVIRTITAALENYNPALEEAAANLGAPPLRVFWEVVLPQARTGIGGGAALAFVISMADATIGIFLRGPGAVPLPAAMIGYMTFRIDPIIGSSAMVFLVVSIVFLLIINRLIGFEAVIGMRRDQ